MEIFILEDMTQINQQNKVLDFKSNLWFLSIKATFLKVEDKEKEE